MAGTGFIQAALNGWRVPMTAERLAEEAAAVAELGCTSVHLHPYDATGRRESLDGRDVATAVAAVRAAAPGVEIGVSTGAWIAHDIVEAIASWVEPLPDMASVNLSEPAHPAILRALSGRGVAIEAGLFTPTDVDRLLASGYEKRVLRALVEPTTAPSPLGNSQTAIAASLERRLDGLGIAAPRVHHGEGPETWDVVAAARARGQAIRVGLEDADVLPDGTPACDNAAIYAAALAL